LQDKCTKHASLIIHDLKHRIRTEWARLDHTIITASVASSLVVFRVCHGLLAITTIFLTVVD